MGFNDIEDSRGMNPLAPSPGRRNRPLILIASLTLSGLALPAGATTIIPPASYGQLLTGSAAVVSAVAGESSVEERGSLLYTSTLFVVDEWLSGPADRPRSFMLEVPGGERDGTVCVVPGMPRFQPGRRYLIPLAAGRLGGWSLKVAAWGLLEEVAGEKGMKLLAPIPESRELGVLPAQGAAGSAAPGIYRRELLLQHVRAVVAGAATWNEKVALASPSEIASAALPQAIPGVCTIMNAGYGPSRWSTFDGGGSVTMSAQSPGDPSISGGGFSQVQAAVAIWMGVPSTKLNLAYGGSTAYTLPCTSGSNDYGTNVVVFGDPCSDIADLVNCGGTLAFGGFTGGGTHTYDGQTWMTIYTWFVVVNNGVGGCLGSGGYTSMLAHEMGHGLGFGHVSDSGALMFYQCCNSIDSTDTTCAQYSYGTIAPVTCTSFSIAPSSASPGSSAGSQSVSITGSPAGCSGGAWTAAGNGSWLSVLPASGTGPSSVTVSWAANSGSARVDGATIAGNTFTVSQAAVPPPCTSFSIFPSSASPGSSAGSQSASITGSPAGCSGGTWTATGNGSWLTVFPGGGTGPSSVSVSWAENTGSARSGAATIAGSPFTVNQAAPPVPCTSFSIVPTSIGVNSPAGSQDVAISGSPAGCTAGAWTASGNGSWLTVLPGGGSGPSDVTVSWTANSGSTRSDYAYIAGKSFLVSQTGNTVGPYGCTPDSRSLCLLGGRFHVQADYVAYGNASGTGKAIPLTSDTGYFWFFDSANVEAVVKMVSFCGGGANNVAVYAGGMTDVDVTLRVTDLRGGATATYRNALGTPFRLIRDGPFSCPASVTPPPEPSFAAAAPLAGWPGSPAVETTSSGTTAACAPDSNTLCLLGGRFEVRTSWADYSGGGGPGIAVPLTSDTGYFWFFNSANVEVVTKMVSFCGGGSNNVGIYAGGLTDISATITVRDTSTGLVKSYTNPLGQPFTLIRDGPFACP